MKTFSLLALAGAVAVVAAQDPGPSPTQSIGCEPHGDHWHCEGPRETDASEHDHDHEDEDDHDHEHEDDHDHDHDHETGSITSGIEVSVTLEPSPTESVGCEPHGDHWHCDGPRETDASAAQVSLEPSPTESVGCEPHGDHWHCDGPAVTSSQTTEAPANETSAPADADSAASRFGLATGLAVMGAVLAALLN